MPIYFLFLDFGLYVSFSCEVLFALYHLHAVLTFALCCAIGLSLFTLFSFVLILKRISQVIKFTVNHDKNSPSYKTSCIAGVFN